MSHVIPDEDHQEGQYFEEVQKIVDRYFAENADNPAENLESLSAIVAASSYCHNQELAIHCLRYSRHPSAFSCTTIVKPTDSESPFPFQMFARAALYRDCLELAQNSRGSPDKENKLFYVSEDLYVLAGMMNPGTPKAKFTVKRDANDKPYVATAANSGSLWLAHYDCTHLYRLDGCSMLLVLSQYSPLCFRHIGYPNRAILYEHDSLAIEQVIKSGNLYRKD